VYLDKDGERDKMKNIFLKIITGAALLVISIQTHANELALITLNPLKVELSVLIRDKIKSFDKDFVVNNIDDYSNEVKNIFLKEPELLSKETPMVILGFFDCDNELDAAVMGKRNGENIMLSLNSLRGYEPIVVPGIPKTYKRTGKDKLERYLSLNQNIPANAKKCHGRTTIDLIQSEVVFSDTQAFYFKKDRWVVYRGQDL
jgi:hypothetical protein